MANPLPNEKELYAQIRREKITVAPDIWDLLYHRIADDISAINLLCEYHLADNQPIPVGEAKKILRYTHHIKDIINKITVATKENFPFPEFLGDAPLHPVLREMFTHYIGNDVYMINLIVEDAIDPLGPLPVSLPLAQKILGHTQTLKVFMEKLRLATSGEDASVEVQAPATGQPALTQEQILERIRKCLAREFAIADPEKIRAGSRFKEDLGLDSTDAIRAIMALEEEFGFEIPDAAAEGVFSVDQAVKYIAKILKPGA